MTLAFANSVYTNLDVGRITIHRVASESFERFSRAVTALSRQVRSDDHENYSTVIWLRRLRFVLSSAPVANKHPFGHCHDASSLARMRIRLALSYPAERPLIDGLFEAIETLRGDSSAPLLVCFEDLLSVCEERARAVALSADASVVQCFETAVTASAKAVGVNLLATGQRGLEPETTFDAMFLFGAAGWFKTALFGAPRAPEIHIIQYAWISAQLPAAPTLPDSSTRLRPLGRRIETAGIAAVGLQLTGDDLRDRPSEEELVAGHGDRAENALVEDARLVTLEAGFGVYLPASEEDRVIVISDSEGSVRVRRISVADLDAGMHLVLRTEGSADYVSAVADARLGNRAVALRSTEQLWKSRLIEFVASVGVQRAAAELCAAGLIYASPAALARWCSPRNIGTKTREAFKILLTIIGLATEADAYWASAEELWTAHRIAGTTIRSMLLDVLRKSDLTRLKRYGKMDIELEVSGAGRLTAFTVSEVSPKIRPVPTSRIGRPFSSSMQTSWLD